MRYVRTILAALALSACSGDAAPDSPAAPDTSGPTVPVAATTFLWAMVVDASGVCITGATIEVVAGQGAGQSHTQETPCDAWAYYGGVTLEGLPPGVAMTLRASAPGYVAQEKTIVPKLGPQTAIVFTPSTQ